MVPKPIPVDRIDSWNCYVGVPIDDHHRLSLQLFAHNPQNPMGVPDPGFRPHAHVFWQEKPNYVAQSVVYFEPVDLSDAPLPPPVSIEFSLPGPRMVDGDLLLAGDDGADVRFADTDPRIDWLAPHFDLHWVKIRDTETLAKLFRTSGWRASHQVRGGGAGNDLGPVRLARWPDVQAAYVRARAELRSKLADPAEQCEAIEFQEPDASEII
jgi:hypothetical protein